MIGLSTTDSQSIKSLTKWVEEDSHLEVKEVIIITEETSTIKEVEEEVHSNLPRLLRGNKPINLRINKYINQITNNLEIILNKKIKIKNEDGQNNYDHFRNNNEIG